MKASDPDYTCQVIADPDTTCQVILDPDLRPDNQKVSDLSGSNG